MVSRARTLRGTFEIALRGCGFRKPSAGLACRPMSGPCLVLKNGASSGLAADRGHARPHLTARPIEGLTAPSKWGDVHIDDGGDHRRGGIRARPAMSGPSRGSRVPALRERPWAAPRASLRTPRATSRAVWGRARRSRLSPRPTALAVRRSCEFEARPVPKVFGRSTQRRVAPKNGIGRHACGSETRVASAQLPSREDIGTP